MSKGKIFQKFWAYEIMNDFLEKNPSQPISRYSYFEEAYKKPKIKKFIELENNKQEFYSWIIKEKFDDTGAKDIRKLSEFLDQEKILNIFRDNGMKAAYHKYYQSKEEDEIELIEIIDDLLQEMKDLTRKQLLIISKDRKNINKIHELEKEIRELLKDLES